MAHEQLKINSLPGKRSTDFMPPSTRLMIAAEL
jgi:hypothetical protein